MKRGYVKINYSGDTSSLMPATLFGIWAVHRCPHDLGNPLAQGWRVTHAPSGLRVQLCDGMSFNDARRAARLLAERVPEIDAHTPGDEDRRIVEAAFGEALGA